MKSIAAFLVLAVAAVPLAAQRLPDRQSSLQRPNALAAADAPQRVVGAIVGGSLGAVAGGYAALWLATRGPCSGEDCHLGSVILLVPVGVTLGVATGAHFGGGSRGSFGNDVAAATVVGIAGLLVAAKSGVPEIIVVTPFLQVVAAAITEVSGHD